MRGTPYSEDRIIPHDDLWLDMGARLFRVMKEAKEKKYRYIMLTKTTNPMDKFDTWYNVCEYKMQKQTKLTKKQ